MNKDPKDTAINEIKRRIVTLEKAKKDFKEWIDEGLMRGGFSDDVIRYWIEVKNEVDKIDNIPLE